jgi:sugar lactone lactonase YvrE
MLIVAATLAGLVALALSAGAGAQPQVSVFARIPSPGYPANTLVAPDGTVYVGTFHSFTTASDTGPAKVFAYSPTGVLKRTYTISGETAGQPHGVQVAATDRQGRLYLLDQAPARIVRLNPTTGTQTTWATFASVPACVNGQPAGACTEGAAGNAPEPDFATWGPDGSLYVTDYNQSLIWRVPPGGGKATVWLTSSNFNGVIVGPAGIEMMPGGHELMFDTGGGGSNIAAGKLYTVPIEPNGGPGPLTQLWQSGQAEAPDGFAIARSGHIYVALVGPSGNAVDELSASGAELARIPANAAANQAQQIPFDAPGSVTFDGDSILVANQSALVNNTADMAVLEVDVGEPGLPQSLPPASATVARCVLRVRPARASAGTRHRFRFVAKSRDGGRLSPLAGATVRFDGHRARTNRAGRAVIVVRLRRRGRRYRARVVRSGKTLCSAVVRTRR